MNGTRSTPTGTADSTLNASTLTPQLVDRREAARVLSVSPGTIDNLRTRGELPSVKIGARRLYDVADLIRLIADRKAVG